MQPFDHNNFDAHEHIAYINDETSGLQAIIAIHSTRLGPAAGGCRMLPYKDTAAALYDVLRLSKGMSYKNAIADLPLGGGKAVIIADPQKDKSPELLKAFGEAVERLNGTYWTAEDMNIGTEDMNIISSVTSYAAGLDAGVAASGNPSPITARGVFEGIKIAMKHKHGTTDLAGVTIAVQGIGNVGYSLCEMLFEDGAQLIVSDINETSLQRAHENFNARVVAIDSLSSAKADIFSPCAGGAILDKETINKLNVSIVAGAANNQLHSPECGSLLYEKDILYIPDYVINGGGIINVASEILQIADPEWVPNKLSQLMLTLEEILHRANEEGQPADIIADKVARERLYNSPTTKMKHDKL
ncbi:MAG: Glu/Leu/Phe/Val family dehydrogenase [Methyloligellaceae bacterium]